MAAIQPFASSGVFDQSAIDAMSFALDDVCKTMHLRPTAKHAREAIAVRIIELASQGEADGDRLRDYMLRGWQPAAVA
ncbi:MAG: hypothetical protein ACXWKA_12345 [Xanthobacteraceae bacterium]